MRRLIVHPQYEGRGIGTALLLELERRCADAERFELFTGERSERAISLYERHGYKKFKTERVSKETVLVYMEKNAPR